MKKEVEPVEPVVSSDDQTQDSRARQTIATVLVSLSMLMFGYVTGWICPTIELLLSGESPVPLTGTQVSWVMGAEPLGAVFGTIPSGLLMSRLGRRGTLMLLNVLPLLSWTLLTYCAASFPLLCAARFLGGTWIGTCFTVVPIYISETVDPDRRSSLNIWPCFMHRLGTLAVFTVGTCYSYWVLSFVGLVFGLFYWIILLIVPESPYYYLMTNKEEKAFKSLAWLQNNNNIDEKFVKLSQFIYAELENKSSIFDLLENPIHLLNVMKVTLATVLMVASGGTLIVILPIIIPENSIPYLNNKLCSIIGALICFLFSLRPKCLTLGSNKLSLVVSGIVCGICMAIMAIWNYFENKTALVRLDLYWVPIFCYFIHIVFYSLYMYPTVMGLRGEMFPTKFKTSLSAFVATAATVTIYIILQIFIPIRTHYGGHVNFIIGSVSSFSLVLLTYFSIIETKGKSLQAIQDDLNSQIAGSTETGQRKAFP